MKITIAAVGRFRESPEQEIFTSYKKRIPWQCELREVEVRKNLKGNQLKCAEAELLLACVPKLSKIIALDERGQNITSPGLASIISSWRDEGVGSIAFVIGGADGLDDKLRARADLILSFGKLTWPHMLIRAMLAEQLYRVHSIMSGHPYHRK